MTEQKTAKHAESLVTSCPQCTAVVSLPSIVSVDARVRCPVCHHQYGLRSVLPEVIPQLELVVDFPQGEHVGGFEHGIDADSMAALEKFSVPDVLKNGAKRRSRDRRPLEQPQTIGEAVHEAQVEAASAKPRVRSRHRGASRKHKKIIEIVKIVMGALLALPVAQVIIWWGLGSDPVQIGPSVGQVAPFLVPEKLRESLDDN